MRRLTAFVDGDTVVLDDTDGNARIAIAVGATELATALRVAWRDGEPAPGSLTASALASLEEATNVRPRPRNLHYTTAPSTHEATEQPIPLGPMTEHLEITLHNVLSARRSQRHFGRIELRQVASLLTNSTRVADIRIAPDGYQGSLRPVPSAGGRHPLDIELHAFDVTGLPQGRYDWDPYLCQLTAAGPSTTEELDRWNSALEGDGSPAAVLALVADPSRTLSYYPAGMAHVWRDAGVLLGYLNLAATACSVKATILGTCAQHGSRKTCWEVGAIALG